MNKDPINILESGNDNLISQLPVELIFDIASRLHYKDIARLCRTSSYLNELFCLDDEIWRILYHRDISTYNLPLKTNYYQQYQKVIKETKNNNKNLNWILNYAAKNGYDKLVNEMIELGADDYNGAMANAARGGHLDIVEKMIKLGADNYNFAMSAAAYKGHVDIVEKMIKLGANNYDMAMSAAAGGGHLDIVERMLQLGANEYNWAMSAAAGRGHLDIVERMLELGANDYNWAMSAAAMEGHSDIVNLIEEWQLSH